VVVENSAKIGARSILHPHVFLGAACRLGDDCEVHPHTSIGSDGFGYAMDSNGKPRKISHLGNVVIGDGVEIGCEGAEAADMGRQDRRPARDYKEWGRDSARGDTDP